MKQASAFDIIVDRTLTVMQDGVPREMTVEEALQQKTYLAALGGSRLAQREIMKMIEKRERVLAANSSQTFPLVERRIEPDPDNADAALVTLGIATRDEGRNGYHDEREPLLLELWAVQTALARRRGGKRLSNKEVAEIKRSMRDAEKLRWPLVDDT